MAWRRRRQGRPRKQGVARHPGGAVVREKITPPPEVLSRRAGFGPHAAETDWIIDQWWSAGNLDDRARLAAHRLNALVRARLARIFAPRAAVMAFHDARGPSAFGDVKNRDDQIAALNVALDALVALDKSGAAKRAVEDVVVYNRPAPLHLVRVGLAAVAAALAKPLPRRAAPNLESQISERNAALDPLGGAVQFRDTHKKQC